MGERKSRTSQAPGHIRTLRTARQLRSGLLTKALKLWRQSVESAARTPRRAASRPAASRSSMCSRRQRAAAARGQGRSNPFQRNGDREPRHADAHRLQDCPGDARRRALHQVESWAVVEGDPVVILSGFEKPDVTSCSAMCSASARSRLQTSIRLSMVCRVIPPLSASTDSRSVSYLADWTERR